MYLEDVESHFISCLSGTKEVAALAQLSGTIRKLVGKLANQQMYLTGCRQHLQGFSRLLKHDQRIVVMIPTRRLASLAHLCNKIGAI